MKPQGLSIQKQAHHKPAHNRVGADARVRPAERALPVVRADFKVMRFFVADYEFWLRPGESLHS
jgi:hypothetical protein